LLTKMSSDSDSKPHSSDSGNEKAPQKEYSEPSEESDHDSSSHSEKEHVKSESEKEEKSTEETSEEGESSDEEDEEDKKKKAEATAVLSFRALMVEKFQAARALAREPQKIPGVLLNKIDKTITNRTFLVFFVVWWPFFFMASGSLIGHVFFLVRRSYHFILGLCAAIYVYKLIKSSKVNAADKARQAILVSSVAPILMVTEQYFIARVVVVVAFSGTPFLLDTYFPMKEVTETKQQQWHHTILQYSTAPAVIFVVAVGGHSIFHNIYVALVFGMACAMAQAAVLPLSGLSGLLDKYHQLLFVLLELLLGNILLSLFQYFMPEALLAEQSGWLVWGFFHLLGIGVLAVGEIVILEQAAHEHIAKLKQAIVVAVCSCYACLMFNHVITNVLIHS